MVKERVMLQTQRAQMQAETMDLGEAVENNQVLDVTTVPKKERMLMSLLFPVKNVLYPIQRQLRQLVMLARISTTVVQWAGKL